jgi:4-alpha-glucanotransferase
MNFIADSPAAAEIGALARLCGIAPEYCDNFGGCHPTAPETCQALLSAMGVPWRDPESRRQELARRRLGPWSRFVEPVQVCSPGSHPRINVYVFTPRPDLPVPLQLSAALTAESGQEFAWQGEGPPAMASRAVPGGFRHCLEVRLPWDLPLGYYDLQLQVEAGGRQESGRTRLIIAPEQSYFPDCLAAGHRLWGFNLPLYALQSQRNWGSGDFGDLRAVMDWAATLGAAFVGVNPLHAPPPLPEADPSPYAPTSRLFNNFLYVDLNGVPEMEHCPEAQALISGRAVLRQGPLVPYDQVFRLKRRALDLLFRVFQERHGPPGAPRTSRGQEFAAFRREKGASLQNFGEFCALTEHFEVGDWRRWPEEYRHPGGVAVAAFAREQPREILLHQYGQWLAATQLQEVAETARRRGLPFSLYRDLALGAGAGGCDTWAYPDLFARGVTIGAPPDAFSPKGQNWGIPPLIPQALRQSGYQLFIDTIRANGPVGGMLRLDHVMGLFRLLWIPAGAEAAAGAYVHYPARELLAVLALESVRRRLLIIGEDLGTVSPRVRRDLHRLGVFSYRVFYFERDAAGHFLAPEHYPARAVAAVTTHDLPTLAGFWQGRDLDFKRAANLYPDPQFAAADVCQRQHDRLKLLEALENRDLLAGAGPVADPAAPCPPAVRQGVLEYLAQTPAALLEVRLEEVFGLAEQQNFPGTLREHPNWRRRLPLTLEDMTRDQEPLDLAGRLNKYRKSTV